MATKKCGSCIHFKTMNKVKQHTGNCDVWNSEKSYHSVPCMHHKKPLPSWHEVTNVQTTLEL